jgi:hypothetical protein
MWRSLYIGPLNNKVVTVIYTNDYKIITVNYSSKGVALNVKIQTIADW